MCRFGVLISLVVLVGCGSLRSGNNNILEYELYRSTVLRSDKVSVPKVQKIYNVIKPHGDMKGKKYKVELRGEMNIDVLEKYFVQVLGGIYASGKVADAIIECDIEGEFTEQEIELFMMTFAELVNYKLVIEKGVYSVTKIVEGAKSAKYARFVELRYLQNKFSGLVDTVNLRRVGNGVLLLGVKGDVLNFVEILKLYDVDMLEGLNIQFVPYSMSVCNQVKEIMRGVGEIDIDFFPVSNACTAMVGRGVEYFDYVLNLLSNVNKKVVGDVYLLQVRNADLERVGKSLKQLLPGINYLEESNGFVFYDYESYQKAASVLKLLDVVERLLHVRAYLLDIQSRGTLDIGADINYNNGQFSALSNVRSAVGLGIFGSYKDFKMFFNFLVQKFDGKVISSPSMVLRNNTESVLNFGQSIPTLKGRQETVGGAIVQSVEYVNIGLGITIKPRLVGQYVYTDLNVFNSSVLENVGVEGNPQFSQDSVKLSLVQRIGSVAVVAGLKRQASESNRKILLFPQSLFKKNESREFVLCLVIDEVSPESDYKNILEKFQKSLDNYDK